MKLRLCSINTVYINLSKDNEKNSFMKGLLKDFESVTRVEGVTEPNKITGVSQAHLNALTATDTPGPLLVLEDDCKMNSFEEELEIPDNTDILFLGLWDMEQLSPPHSEGGVMFPKYKLVSDKLSRVYTMMGAHAIVFVSDFAKVLAKKVYAYSVKREYWQDEALNQTLVYLNAYALNTPVFVQSSNLTYTQTKLG